MNQKPKNKWLFWINASLLIFLVSAYIFSAQGMVVNAVKNRNVRVTTDKLVPTISELEAQYASLQNEITLEKAYTLGFKDADSEFLNSAPLGKNVSIRNEIQ